MGKEEVEEEHFFKKHKAIWIPALIVFAVLILVIFYTSSQRTSTIITEYEPQSALEKIKDIVTPSECGNGRCETGEDSSSCCLDCNCPYGYSCDGYKCKKLAQCGNNACEEGESSSNCCSDCGCPSGQACENNACIELRPELATSFSASKVDSVTILKANGNGMGTISIMNTGNDDAINTKIVVSSPTGYFGDKTINVGTVYRNQPATKILDLNFNENILDITSDQTLQMNAKIEYYNSANEKYETTDTYSIPVKGRNYFSHWYSSETAMISSWVTPNQDVVREFASKSTGNLATYSDSSLQLMAARWIFESMRAYGVKYTTDAHVSGDYVQFPVETLKNKGGDCEDNAILYASLLEAVGLESVIILIPQHAFSGYINKEGQLIPIETTADEFSQALYSGTGKYDQYKNSKEIAIVYPSRNWQKYRQVILPEKFQLSMPDISKDVGECKLSFTFENGWIAKLPVLFTNNGNAPGAGCAVMYVYNGNNQKIDDDLSCWKVYPGESKTFDYVVDITVGDLFSGYICSGY